MDSSLSPSVLSKSDAPGQHRGTVRALLATADEHTAGWATHLIIFGSFGAVASAAMKRLIAIPRHDMWETRRVVAKAMLVLSGMSYCESERTRLKKELAEDDNLQRIQKVTNKVHNVDWRNKAAQAVVDPSASSSNGIIAPDLAFSNESISSKIGRLTSRTWSTSAARQHFAAVLQPYLQRGSLSPYDYDVGVTHLSHVSNDSTLYKVEFGAFIAAVGSLVVYSPFGLATIPFKIINYTYGLTQVFIITIVTRHYQLDRLPTTFKDRGAVAQVLEQALAAGKL